MVRKAKREKLFVLDTNVLLHDPSSLFRFHEHDIYIPMVTLEELDHHKKGHADLARSARSVSRTIDSIIEQSFSSGKSISYGIENGFSLRVKDRDQTLGNLFIEGDFLDRPEIKSLDPSKPDNIILATVIALKRKSPNRSTILVSKDINIRIKAHALGIEAEDYHSDKVIDDSDILYSGHAVAPPGFMNSVFDSRKVADRTEYMVNLKKNHTFHPGMYLSIHEDGAPHYAVVKEINCLTAIIETIPRFDHVKHAVWGVTARNPQQVFALEALMNPNIPFVSLVGQAGSGKTLLALAASLDQVLDKKAYQEIIITRATVPIGDDIGFLPGTEEEKMNPWMGAIDDNLDFLHSGCDSSNEWGRAATRDLINARIKIKSLNFMRGRTFLNKYVIIDESQNLTPKQMKTLVTRAGPETKIVCLGNLSQIDTPYLTEGSSGLTFVVDRFKGNYGLAHVMLEKVERSWLAEKAAQLLS